MIIRLYTGDDGQAHFEDLNVPAGEAETVALQAGADMNFRSFPGGSFSDWHNAPRVQYVIVLAGQMEIGIGDGSKRVLDPGDILQVEDVTGQGHTM
jgi:quercetin dioxygenase-like cupin family protein